MIFSQDEDSFYFHKFYLMSFKVEKGVRFLTAVYRLIFLSTDRYRVPAEF